MIQQQQLQTQSAGNFHIQPGKLAKIENSFYISLIGDNFPYSIWEVTEFSLLNVRAYAAVAHLSNDSLLFMGGLAESSSSTQTSELLDLTSSGQATQGPDLPAPNRFLCGSNLNSTHAFMGTGYDGSISAQTYLLELATGDWIQLDNLPGGGRYQVKNCSNYSLFKKISKFTNIFCQIF